MSKPVNLGGTLVGPGVPTYIIAEIGINHNGNLGDAKKLIDAAVAAQCNAVKFQKRTPEISVPPEQRDIIRDTPWGRIPYLEYRKRVEFGEEEYREINDYCLASGIAWLTSCWDTEAVDFIEGFNPIAHKVASACLTNDDLLKKMKATGRPIILSTGMSTFQQIEHAISIIGVDDLIICHCTSSYPCPPEELNLSMINSLRRSFDCPIGYSGHEVGLQTTVAAVTLGACLIERHITLDRARWGSDQAASIEPHGFRILVRDVRTVEAAMGDGTKKVYESEIPIRAKLRWKG
jgi:N-acetylneuraminate synthase